MSDLDQAIEQAAEAIDDLVGTSRIPLGEVAAILREHFAPLVERLQAKLGAATARWTVYEQEYILPCFDWATSIGFDLNKAVRESPGNNCVKLFVQHLIAERDRLKAENERLREQVNKLIESCYYRTKAGKVHWKQGSHFGTSTADDTDPAAFEQAMAAIRWNAGIEELQPQ